MIRIASLLCILSLSISSTAQTVEFDACTSIMVSAGASTDGSVMITYSADAPFLPKLLRNEGGPQKSGELIDIVGWEDERVRGQVKQIAKTNAVVGLMNEHQLALGETTTGGRRELRNPEGLLDYDALMWLTLAACVDRARGDSHHRFAVPGVRLRFGRRDHRHRRPENEAWVMEIIGKGPGVPGAVWVAARVPEGCISASANMSRITTLSPRRSRELAILA